MEIYLFKEEEVADYKVSSYMKVTDNWMTVVRKNTADAGKTELFSQRREPGKFLFKHGLSASENGYQEVTVDEYEKVYWEAQAALQEANNSSLSFFALMGKKEVAGKLEAAVKHLEDGATHTGMGILKTMLKNLQQHETIADTREGVEL